MILVQIQNSWQLDLVRLYKHRSDFKTYYYNLVVSEVFQKSGHRRLGTDLTIFFCDNHYCNVDNLDYKKLHCFLCQFFCSVSFVSDNPYDLKFDPDYWSLAEHQNADRGLFVAMSAAMPSINAVATKMFGLHILRPDTHRLALLVALHRQGLLPHVDVRLGFRSNEFTMLEYRRSSNIDTVCFDFDIAPRELFDLIDSLPEGDRNNFQDNATTQGRDHVAKDTEKNLLSGHFAIELVCASSVHDHVVDFGEKIMRPMLCRQPFVWISSADSNRRLADWGFKTFNEFWNESWDHYEEEWLPTKIDEIAKTCKHIVDTYEINDIKNLCRHIVTHNFNRLHLCVSAGWSEQLWPCTSDSLAAIWSK